MLHQEWREKKKKLREYKRRQVNTNTYISSKGHRHRSHCWARDNHRRRLVRKSTMANPYRLRTYHSINRQLDERYQRLLQLDRAPCKWIALFISTWSPPFGGIQEISHLARVKYRCSRLLFSFPSTKNQQYCPLLLLVCRWSSQIITIRMTMNTTI